VNESALERQLVVSRTRMDRLRRRAEHEGVATDSPLAAAVEELGHTLEELTVALEQLEVANEELADARHAAERHALRYRELFDFAPDLYLATDERGVIREANRTAEIKLGREARHLVGKPLVIFVAESHAEALSSRLVALQAGRPARIEGWEARFAPRGAPPFWAAVRADATRGPDGGVSEIRWLLRDVTERRRADDALRASEGRIRLIAEALPVCMGYVDTEQRFRFVNATYESWFAMPRDQMLGHTVREVLGDAAYERIRACVARALAGERVRFEGELPYARGGARHVALVYVPHRADSGDVQGFFTLVSDVTEQKRMERQLRNAAAAAALAEDRERKHLAHDLHDGLGQLLTLVAMKLGSLRDAFAAGDASAREPFREIEMLVGQAHAWTESLTFQLSPPILHDRGFVPAAEWLAEDLARKYGLRVEVADDGAPKPLDEASAVALFRALRELLINVARHAGTTETSVRTWCADDRLYAEVRDRGYGFDPERPGGGFGLLSLRERLVALGGGLEIESTPGNGTRAVAAVPLAAGAEP
jgi:PAS domain S-box-containing protein